MQTTKQTYKRINQFVTIAQILLTSKIDDNKLAKDEKLVYGLRRVLPKCHDALTEYNEQVEDINVEFASVDDNGNLLRESPKEYKFAKENAQKRLVKIRELFRTKEHEVFQYFVTEIPEWLTEDIKVELYDFVIERPPDD